MRRVLTTALLAVFLLVSLVAAQVSLAVTLPPQHSQYVARVIELVNVERQRVGRSPLVANAALMQGAQTYAGVMGDGTCFSHSCGSTLVQRINGAGYTNWTAAGENIALGQSTPEAVMAAWMNSQGHRDNLLNGTYMHIGVGLAARSNGQLVWVQMFGASTTQVGMTPTPIPTATPTLVPTATPTPAVPVNCTPRPAFSVRTRTTAPGVLEVTVTAGTETGPTRNTLAAIRLGSVRNGTVDVTGYGRAASDSTVRMASGAQQVTMVVRRATPGAATTVPLVLTDGCGEWRTFVGGGANGF
jgi:uncharacterized protein YkwD